MEKVCCGQIDTEPTPRDHGGMAKKRGLPSQLERSRNRRSKTAPRPAEPELKKRTLHLGPWLRRKGLKQIEVANKAGIGKSYMSQLVSGKKDEPSALLMLYISEAMGVTVNALYRPPPTQQQVDRAKGLTPEQIVMIGDLVSVLGIGELNPQ